MTTVEISQYKKILQAKVIELEHSARRRDGIAIEGTADEMERISGQVERELAVRHLETKSAKLREARAALLRMEERTYGICEECEEPISARRLAALPFAALCIRCQEAADCRCGATAQRSVLAMAA
jgi:DnaK suppressor protein